MERVTGIGGIFFRSADPEALAAWYATHLGVDMSAGAWLQQTGYTVFAPFPKDTEYFPSDRQWMLNFRVADLDTMTAQLEAAGIKVLTDPDWNSHVGRFARLHDPEGNPIELWEPSEMAQPPSPD